MKPKPQSRFYVDFKTSPHNKWTGNRLESFIIIILREIGACLKEIPMLVRIVTYCLAIRFIEMFTPWPLHFPCYRFYSGFSAYLLGSLSLIGSDIHWYILMVWPVVAFGRRMGFLFSSHEYHRRNQNKRYHSRYAIKGSAMVGFGWSLRTYRTPNHLPKWMRYHHLHRTHCELSSARWNWPSSPLSSYLSFSPNSVTPFAFYAHSSTPNQRCRRKSCFAFISTPFNNICPCCRL